jgi:hypothetical protein
MSIRQSHGNCFMSDGVSAFGGKADITGAGLQAIT